MNKYIFPLLIIVTGVYLGWKLLTPGMMQTHDGIWHIERIIDMAKLIPLGHFPVRWSPDLDNGFGIPLFNFAYPGPYYLMGIVHSFGVGVIATFNFTNLFFYLLGGVGVYYLFRGKFPFLAFAVALLYLLTPYQFLDIFVRGALGEVVVLGLIPWSFLGIKNLENNGKISWYSSIPLALILISHNFLGFIFLGLILVLTVFIYQKKRLVLAHILVALGLSAFFWLPMLSERNLLLPVPSGLQNTQFDAHYVHPTQFLISPWNYDGSLPGLDPREISYQLGMANVVLWLAAIFTVFAFRRLYLGIVTLTLFLMTPYSDLLWDLVPALQIIQFPWRLLAIVAVLSPFLIYALLESYARRSVHVAYLIAGAALALALVSTAGFRRPNRVLTDQEFANLHDSYSGKTATAYRYELTPKWAVEERSKPDVITVNSGSAVVSNLSDSPYSVKFSASSDNPAVVTVYRNYYPSWTASADGGKLPLSPAVDGSISLTLVPGTHEYRVYLGSTPIALLSNIISLISLLYLLRGLRVK